MPYSLGPVPVWCVWVEGQAAWVLSLHYRLRYLVQNPKTAGLVVHITNCGHQHERRCMLHHRQDAAKQDTAIEATMEISLHGIRLQ